MKGLSAEEKRDLIISVGTHRGQRKLQPVLVASLIQKSLNAGTTLDEVSKEITLSKRVIQKFLSLLYLPSDVLSLVGWGSDQTTISFTAAAEIARLGTEHEKQVLAKAALEHQVTVPEMKQVIQIRQRSEKSIEQSIDAVIKQRPIVERRYLIIGKLLSDRLLMSLENMSQQDQNVLLDRALILHGPGKPTYGAKLAVKFFYIVGDEDYHKNILSLPNGFERDVTDFLLLELEDGGQEV